MEGGALSSPAPGRDSGGKFQGGKHGPNVFCTFCGRTGADARTKGKVAYVFGLQSLGITESFKFYNVSGEMQLSPIYLQSSPPFANVFAPIHPLCIFWHWLRLIPSTNAVFLHRSRSQSARIVHALLLFREGCCTSLPFVSRRCSRRQCFKR